MRAANEAKAAREKLEQEEARRRERQEHLRQRGEAGTSRNRSQKYQNTGQKDLKQQQKILRDHGLVMGHVNEEFLS